MYLTGSSARLLSREMATQMRGRSLSWELFPFSFAEFLDFKGIQVHPETGRNRLLALKAFEEYWQNFIWQDASGKRHLAQVCESMAAHPETQRRELTALTEAMQEMKLTEGIIVTRSESQELKTPSGRITVMPAWKFLLS